ncbi:MAG: 50S ribosomal protein L29 [Candidatus Niyogibacteria bacterium RIFCSPLOWO2_01_FULL_45_48]|uniref:Large ribosomal subunit protein uL29 n=2 Tax=Candidatus Niyogiibacteriota TaxID=1817912 RepID=A0A1G2EZH0_9BACT|nr:MAG: 50S ribosomal protein L29 [Candidatus Niyogibacteria bacterium RIFCSPHIGHO2_01_FULL_45_28]OGZ30740.1 MAG: 50S ribosomal protein L29 [Candidatus Niyogibacteria bacterium RIFCSPLOWO2_01_FULL_45_48]OGZ31175.1 MAG: 50S ribosomal protein L29 [Candidatus Niyogibacteria bacterium RIFCSPLOWO2_02_FULL_45_13]
MKTKNIMQQNNVSDLRRELKENREQLRRFRFSLSQSKIKNVKIGRETRRTVARIMTRINQIKTQ